MAPLLARADVTSLEHALRAHRSDIHLSAGSLAGPGGDVLRAAARGARFVIVGEDHGIAEIPRIAGALYELLQPAGFNTLVVETGPYAAREVAGILARKDKKAGMRAYMQKYPFSLAFYTLREEFELLARAAELSGKRFRLIGIDQELMGASKLLLHEVLERKPPGRARERTRALLAEEARHYQRAAESGNPEELFMMSAEESALIALRDALRASAPGAAAPVEALLESRAIYQQAGSSGYLSNQRRARLMKRNLVAALGRDAGKVMVKLGAVHGFKGVNPLHIRDVGSFLAELADGHDATSLHLLVLGARGHQAEFAGIGKPMQPAEIDLRDPDALVPGLAPLLDIASESSSCSLFDLRPLRPRFHSFESVDRETERIIFGYDLVLLIPEATAATEIR